MPDSLLAMARTGDRFLGPGDALPRLGDGFLAGLGCTGSLVARVRGHGRLVHLLRGDNLAAPVHSCPAGGGIAAMLLVNPRRLPPLVSMAVLILAFGFVVL